MEETRKEKLMRILDISAEEAEQLIADDISIDKGEKLFELSEEQKKVEKKMRQADRAPTTYKFNKRERKTDNDKIFLLDLMMKALPAQSQCEVVNPEREFTFMYNGKKYKITMSCPRS